MAIDYEPFCCVCGGPFSHVELLDSSELGEDDRYHMDGAYDSQVLSPAQTAVGRNRFDYFPLQRLTYRLIRKCSGSVIFKSLARPSILTRLPHLKRIGDMAKSGRKMHHLGQTRVAAMEGVIATP